MLTRRNLIGLLVIVVVLFAIAIPTGSHHHGFVNVVSNVTWYGGIICLLLLIVLSVVALVQSRRPKNA
jgi:hypothetical protein